MKFAVRSVGVLLALGTTPFACSVHEPDLGVVKSMCPTMGLNVYEFQPIGVDPSGTNEPLGSFEGDFYTPAGAMIIDDDDLTDDYSAFIEVRKWALELIEAYADSVAIWESLEPDGEYSEEEQAAIDEVSSEIISPLSGSCSRLVEGIFAPKVGDNLSDLSFLQFTYCKDRYDATGDGVVGTFDLATTSNPQDAELAACVTVSEGNNQTAMNFWGPLSTQESEIEGLPSNPRDGFTYSGITVPLYIAAYQQTADFSKWDGIAFWARLASASEAIPISDGIGDPLSNATDLPDGARPQDGVGQLGVIIQTMDTAAVLAGDTVDGLSLWTVCTPANAEVWEQHEGGEDVMLPTCFKDEAAFDAFPGMENEDGTGKYAYRDANGYPQTPELPFCIDYSPIDAEAGSETPYRDQCWDGFRSMLDITTDWKFYFLPFDEMRQAGWGRVAKEFRTDQIRSVNFLTSAFQPANVMVDEVAFYRRKADGMGGSE